MHTTHTSLEAQSDVFGELQHEEKYLPPVSIPAALRAAALPAWLVPPPGSLRHALIPKEPNWRLTDSAFPISDGLTI